MKSTRLLRVLSLLGFLLLMAPFYSACDDSFITMRDIKGKSFTESLKIIVDDVIIDESANNGFEFASVLVFSIYESVFEPHNQDNMVLLDKNIDETISLGLFFLTFDIIVIQSFSILVLSFIKKEGLIRRLAIINSLLVIITICIIVLIEIHPFAKIKWGYYAFLITNILIFYYSNPKFINPKS